MSCSCAAAEHLRVYLHVADDQVCNPQLFRRWNVFLFSARSVASFAQPAMGISSGLAPPPLYSELSFSILRGVSCLIFVFRAASSPLYPHTQTHGARVTSGCCGGGGGSIGTRTWRFDEPDDGGRLEIKLHRKSGRASRDHQHLVALILMYGSYESHLC